MAGIAWEEAARFLADGAFDPPPRVIETHSARIHLTRDEAWKLRRPVDYGWLDYSTRAQRRAMARREIALNAPHAPGLYLGLGGVGPGPLLVPPDAALPEDAEPLVVMRRFADDALMDRMAEAGLLDAPLLAETGRVVAAMHRASGPVGSAMRMPAMISAEAAELGAMAGALGKARTEAMLGALRSAAERLRDTAAGRPLHRCHGDLHLGNLVLWQGAPTPFDCIEFNEAFSTVDPLYDLSFLTMDLRHRGLGRLLPAALSAWAEAMAAEPGSAPETAYGGLALLPLYEACHAAIRAKTGVIGLAAQADDARPGAEREARAYAELATAILDAPRHPRVIGVGGLSGSGKSALARALAARTGGVVLRSDAIRKGLLGLPPDRPAPPEAYAAGHTGAVYATMRRRAAAVLDAGLPAILDATHLRDADRTAAEALAADAGVPFDGIWLDAPRETLAARIAARRGDVSDATPEVLARQQAEPPGPHWHRLDASAPPDVVLAAAGARLMMP